MLRSRVVLDQSDLLRFGENRNMILSARPAPPARTLKLATLPLLARGVLAYSEPRRRQARQSRLCDLVRCQPFGSLHCAPRLRDRRAATRDGQTVATRNPSARATITSARGRGTLVTFHNE